MASDSQEKVKDADVEMSSAKESENVIHPILWKFLLLLGVMIYSSYTILVHLCEKDGKMPFKSSSMVLMIEITKFVMSAVMFVPEMRRQGGVHLPPWAMIVPFAIPAVLYCANNNLAVYIQLEMDPATYQVLGNFKILSTAILFRLIIKKPITNIQWLALCLLLLAGITNSYGGLSNNKSTHNAGLIHVTLTGLCMISVYCFISGLSGVYTEYVLKKQKQLSIHLQNSLLYSFGMVFNGLLFWFQCYETGDYSLFSGYSAWTWMLVVTQAVGGIIMGVIMKHASNITRLFLISTAMVLTTIVSMLIFGLQLNVYFLASIATVSGALYLYHL